MARGIGKKGRSKLRRTLHEFKHGSLHSGSKKGPRVRSRKQAIAIALNQARRASRAGGYRRGK